VFALSSQSGLRYSNMQTTALCSPSRGSILTGRNHHALGLSAITELSLGFPAHNGIMAAKHGFLSEILLEKGYNTFAIGKWHLTPPEEGTLAGPFNRWPLGRGFERYYGFLGGDTDQWHPDLTYDNHPVEQPKTPEEGYHLNVDLADKAIEFIKDANNNAPEKPFFLYYATGAGHAPHQVEKEWVEPYRGRFDDGWDAYRETVLQRQVEMGIVAPGTVLAERDPDVPAWDSLSDDEQRMYARQMETYAGFLTQTDHHFGRIIAYLDEIGELDNTIVAVISDCSSTKRLKPSKTTWFTSMTGVALIPSRTIRGDGPGLERHRSAVGNAKRTEVESLIRSSCPGRQVFRIGGVFALSTPTRSTSSQPFSKLWMLSRRPQSEAYLSHPSMG